MIVSNILVFYDLNKEWDIINNGGLMDSLRSTIIHALSDNLVFAKSKGLIKDIVLDKRSKTLYVIFTKEPQQAKVIKALLENNALVKDAVRNYIKGDYSVKLCVIETSTSSFYTTSGKMANINTLINTISKIRDEINETVNYLSMLSNDIREMKQLVSTAQTNKDVEMIMDIKILQEENNEELKPVIDFYKTLYRRIFSKEPGITDMEITIDKATAKSLMKVFTKHFLVDWDEIEGKDEVEKVTRFIRENPEARKFVTTSYVKTNKKTKRRG